MPSEYKFIGPDSIMILRFLKLIYPYHADYFPCKFYVEFDENEDESYYLATGKQIIKSRWEKLTEVQKMIDFLEKALALQHLILRKGEDNFVFCHVAQTRLFSFFHRCFILNYKEFTYIPFRKLHKNLRKDFLHALKNAYDREIEQELKKKPRKNPILLKISRLIRLFQKSK